MHVDTHTCMDIDIDSHDHSYTHSSKCHLVCVIQRKRLLEIKELVLTPFNNYLLHKWVKPEDDALKGTPTSKEMFLCGEYMWYWLVQVIPPNGSTQVAIIFCLGEKLATVMNNFFIQNSHCHLRVLSRILTSFLSVLPLLKENFSFLWASVGTCHSGLPLGLQL